MSEIQPQFRNAAFGGFNKQDVMAYLEASSREHGDKTASLQRELEQVKQERDETRQAVADGEAQAQTLKEENRRLAADLADRETALAQLRGEQAELTARAEGLKAEVTRLTPGATAYEGLRDRTAGIELEAHGRAHAIEQEAVAKVKKTKAELDAWLERLQSGYDRLRTDLDATISHASGELERVNQSLNGISDEFNEHDEALQALRDEVEHIVGPKAPQPLPLDETP